MFLLPFQQKVAVGWDFLSELRFFPLLSLCTSWQFFFFSVFQKITQFVIVNFHLIQGVPRIMAFIEWEKRAGKQKSMPKNKNLYRKIQMRPGKWAQALIVWRIFYLSWSDKEKDTQKITIQYFCTLGSRSLAHLAEIKLRVESITVYKNIDA